jgi:hypothetical protein
MKLTAPFSRPRSLIHTPRGFEPVLLSVLLSVSLPLGNVHANSQTNAPSSVQEWQEKAVSEFPDLGVPQSEFNRLFVEQAALLRQTNAPILQEPSWPYRLAQLIAKKLSAQGGTEPARVSEGSQPQLATAPPSPKTNSAALGEVRGEKSHRLHELCLSLLEEKWKSGEIKGRKEDWVHAGRIRHSRMAEALLLAHQTSADLLEVAKMFSENLLTSAAHNHPEDRKWAEALLLAATHLKGPADTNPALRQTVAALLGMEEADFIFRLLDDVEDAAFAEQFLYGRLTAGVADSVPNPTLRAGLLAKFVKSGCKVGKLTLSKSGCVDFLWKAKYDNRTGISGFPAFELLESFEMQDWPETMFRLSSAPTAPFSKADNDWASYQDALRQMWLNLEMGRDTMVGVTRSKNAPSPGLFEDFLLWHLVRLKKSKQFEERHKWLKEVRQHVLKGSSPTLRERKGVIDALENFLAEGLDPENP